VPLIMGEEAWAGLPNLKRLLDEISARPAAQRTEFPFAWRTRLDETVMVVRPAGRLVLPWCERARY
jgi:hypothetical protein